MRRNILLAATVLLACVLWTPHAVRGQEQPQSAPVAKADTEGQLRYEVTAVTGNVRFAPTGTDPLQDAGWQKVRAGDLLGAGLQIHVPSVRAAVKLTARPSEPPTVILIERGTLVNISELFLDHEKGVARSRVKLAYGAIRAGVAEGATRSDMEIESPSATLSKRGTDIFRIEARNGRFVISLSEQGRGLVQAIQTHSTQFGGLDQMRSRFVTPGQFVTQQMMRAIDNVQFDRNININDAFGVQGLDELFTLLNDHGGFAFLLPPGGTQAGLFSGTGAAGAGLTLPFTQEAQNTANQQLLQALFRNTVQNAAGNFGIGQGAVPGVFAAQKIKNSGTIAKSLSQTATVVRQAAKNTR